VNDQHPISCQCPRCGYDLSGVIVAWDHSCPLEGTCSECGLALQWSKVLNPVLSIPPWFLEHPYKRIFRNFLPTFVRALRPRRFWNRIRMEHPIRRGRLAHFVFEILLSIHLIIGYLTVACTYSIFWPARVANGEIPTSIVSSMALALVFPYREWQPDYSVWAGADSIPPIIDAWGPFWLLWIIFTPAAYLLLGTTMRRTKVRKVHLVRVAVYSLAPLSYLAGLYYLIVACRSSWWDLTPPPWVAAEWIDRGCERIDRVVSIRVIFSIIIGLWLLWSWRCASRYYLKIPHALGVATAMMLIGGLLAFLLMLAVDSRVLINPRYWR